MTLRSRLLTPALLTVFLGFAVFVAYETSTQDKETARDMEEEMANLSELVSTANISYVWTYDTIGLQMSVESMIKDPQIVGIEIFSSAGDSLAKAEEEGKPNLYTRESELVRDGMKAGKAKITFTDHYLRAKSRALVSNIAVFVGILFVVIAAVMTVFTGRAVKPIVRLTSITKDMAEGEGDLTVRIPARGDDEVARLSRYFNVFLDKLSAIVASLKNVGEQSSEISAELAGGAQEASASSTQISSSARAMSDRVGFLREEIGKSSDNVEKINAFIARVVDMIQEQAAAVNESSAAVQEMIANAANIERSTEGKLELVRGLESLAKRLEEGAALNVKAMDESSRSTELIAEMIGVINDVASRTNLLAMNAAIEAAHAGTYGRGFSVVADEIRKLAEQTADNAKSIGETIGRVVSGIEKASTVTRESSGTIAEVISGIGAVAGGMNETLLGLKEMSIGNTQIIESLGALNKMTEEVKSSGSGMRQGTEDIGASIRRIIEITEENKRGIEEMAAGIREISDSMAALSDLSVRNSSNIATLDDAMRKFKTE